jgi:hypothetical protein
MGRLSEHFVTSRRALHATHRQIVAFTLSDARVISIRFHFLQAPSTSDCTIVGYEIIDAEVVQLT